MSGVELLAGGAITLPFNALYDVLKGVVKNTRMFRAELEALRLKINLLGPLISVIALDKRLGRDQTEAKELLEISEKMSKGKELIGKCSEVSRWNILKKNSYTYKLVELDGSLKRLLEILKLQGLVVGMETLVTAKKIEAGLDVMVQNQSEMQILVKEIHDWMGNQGPFPIMFTGMLLVSMVMAMAMASKDANWFVFNVGNNSLTFNN